MPKVDTEKFVELIKRSGLVAQDKMDSVIAQVRESHQGEMPVDTESVAKEFIEAKLLNRWQADNLLEGKYKGFRLGKYRLLGHLGTGGMSSVYLAEHPVMERRVAIKVLPKRSVENANYLDRFRREARAVAALDHPNIVRAYDIDNEGDTHYLVMEYVDGRDLQRMVDEDGSLSEDLAADFIAQVAIGLQHAHKEGLIHRDIKPANCLVDTQGTVKILDLGLAKFFDEDRPALSSIYNDCVVGTADYLAPEQAINSQTVDYRADIYSLGCTLYFLLTGHPPFPEGTLAERLLKHQKETPASIYKDRPDVSPALVDLCRRMMHKDREQRMQTVEEVAHAMCAWLSGRGKSLGGRGARIPLPPPVAANRGTRFPWPTPPVKSPSTTRPGHPSTAETTSSADQDTARIKGKDGTTEELTLAPLEEDSSDLLGRRMSNVRKPNLSSASGSSKRSSASGKIPTPNPEGKPPEKRSPASPSSRINLAPIKSLDLVTDSDATRRLAPRRTPTVWEQTPVWVWLLGGAVLFAILVLLIAIVALS